MLFAAAALAVAALCKAAGDPASAPAAPAPRPFVALLLPVDAPDFTPPAEAVLDGCRAALHLAAGKPDLELVRTDVSPGQIMTGHAAAEARGASVIVGPMTRSGVTALAESGNIGTLTLALNAPERPIPMPRNLYTFGLSIDLEARQVARSAWAGNLRDAIIVRSASVLSRRASQAFADEWAALGGKLSEVQEFDAKTNLTRLQERLNRFGPHLFFLSADPGEARSVRPYLNSQVPVFATSQINSGHADPLVNLDLNGIRFVEMPWLVQPDNLTAMIYPRPDLLAPALQRFYALGIDACRIANEFLSQRTRLYLEGITGTLTLKASGTIERVAMPSVFRDGAAVSLDER